MSGTRAGQANPSSRGDVASQAVLLLAQAAPLSGVPFLAAPVQEFFRQVDRLTEIFVRWPAAWASLSDHEVRCAVGRCRGELDFYLQTPPADALAEALADALAADQRLATVGGEPLGLLERLRQRALTELHHRGVRRMQVTPGSPFADGEVVPSDEAPYPTSHPHLCGRVARVRPGHGGWYVNGAVAAPALAQPYGSGAVDSSSNHA